MAWRVLRGAAALFVLAGAPAMAQQAEPPPESIWRVAEGGGAVHVQSSLRCEQRNGAFALTKLSFFHPGGLDVACNFSSQAHDLITLYLTRRQGQSLQDDFETAKGQLVDARPDARPIATPRELAFASPAQWLSQIYRQDEKDLLTGVWVTDIAGWTLKFRGTASPDEMARVVAAIADIAQVALTSASPRLAICAASPPPQRAGKPVDDDETRGMAITMTSFADPVLDGRAAPREPDPLEPGRVWCAEEVMESGQTLYLMWRAVAPDGADLGVDAMTPATFNRPAMILSAPADLLNMVSEIEAAEAGTAPLSHWLVSDRDGATVWVFGVFDGRPDAQRLATLIGQIRSGEAEPVGGYEIDGNQIKLGIPSAQK